MLASDWLQVINRRVWGEEDSPTPLNFKLFCFTEKVMNILTLFCGGREEGGGGFETACLTFFSEVEAELC